MSAGFSDRSSQRVVGFFHGGGGLAYMPKVPAVVVLD